MGCSFLEQNSFPRICSISLVRLQILQGQGMHFMLLLYFAEHLAKWYMPRRCPLISYWVKSILGSRWVIKIYLFIPYSKMYYASFISTLCPKVCTLLIQFNSICIYFGLFHMRAYISQHIKHKSKEETQYSPISVRPEGRFHLGNSDTEIMACNTYEFHKLSCRMVRSISWPPLTRCQYQTPQLWQPNMSPDIAKFWPGDKIAPNWELLV